jgi:rubrerythrin
MPTTLDALVARSRRIDVEAIDLEAFRRRPLDVASLACLRYMCDIESHTVCYLRELLATPVHADPAITRFLACWVYEEQFHGDAIGAILEVHGLAGAPSAASAIRRSRRLRDWLRLVSIAGVAPVVSSLPALFMTWGLVNELTTQAGYARLIARADHPALTAVLTEIMKQEGRHIDFYAMQARELLENPARQRFVRRALVRFWEPVGSGVKSRREVRELIRALFAGEEGVAAIQRIDRRIARLPGLAGLALVQRAVERLAPELLHIPAAAPATNLGSTGAVKSTTSTIAARRKLSGPSSLGELCWGQTEDAPHRERRSRTEGSDEGQPQEGESVADHQSRQTGADESRDATCEVVDSEEAAS